MAGCAAVAEGSDVLVEMKEEDSGTGDGGGSSASPVAALTESNRRLETEASPKRLGGHSPPGPGDALFLLQPLQPRDGRGPYFFDAQRVGRWTYSIWRLVGRL